MNKRLFAMVLALVLCFCAAVPVLAATEMPRLVDGADLLTDSEESSLLSLLDSISEKHSMDVVVVTVDSTGNKSPRAFADDFYDENGYRYDGILLLVSMEERDWWISTCGYGITAFTDAGIDHLSEQFLPDLSDGYYADAFEIYAVQCDDFIEQAKAGQPYNSGNLPKDPFNAGKSLIISLIIGLLIAFIVTAVMKSQLKTVRSQAAAGNYVKNGSLNITESSDLFLYRHVDRREKPKDSSTHRSSSGRSHGGGGGKF